jgi:dynein heavy chain
MLAKYTDNVSVLTGQVCAEPIVALQVDKAGVLDKFAIKGPTNSQYEEKLAKYDKMAAEMYAQAKNHDIYFLSISCHSIATSLRDECLAWVAAICKVMRNIDIARLQELNDLILEYKDGLHHTPDTLDELKVCAAEIKTECNSSPHFLFYVF